MRANSAIINIWKKTVYKGIEFPYEINPLGQVRNKRGKILKPYLRGQRYGIYPAVGLNVNGLRRIVDVHRLVALHFVVGAEPKFEIDHINKNHLNPTVWNLKAVTHKENMERHAWPSLIAGELSFIKDKNYHMQELKIYGDTVPF